MSSTLSRQPLQPLPLALFHGPSASGSAPASASFPSPSSLPSKRAAPSPKSSTHDLHSKASIYDLHAGASIYDLQSKSSIHDLHSTVKRPRTKEITPRQKEVLARDELGLGKSPARRLFDRPSPNASASGSVSGSGGVRGVTIFREEQMGESSTSPRTVPNRTLAPSPPIESRRGSFSSASSSKLQDESERTCASAHELHDPGFVIHSDETSSLSTGNNPASRWRSSVAAEPASIAFLALDASSHSPSSTSSTVSGSAFEDQENIPPPCLGPGTPTSKPLGPRGRSKLIEMLYGEVDGAESENDEEGSLELTPGRLDADGIMKGKGKGTPRTLAAAAVRERASEGKERLRREVDRI